MALRMCLIALLLLTGAAPAVAKEYRASRFDSKIEVLRGGSLRVTETIVFEFTSGTFKRVFRTIPTRRTDGVEFIQASMDGVVLPRGSGTGHVEVRHKNGLRVEWHFTPVSNTTHTFELTYMARGVVRLDGHEEVLAWRTLPSDHDYEIGASTLQVHVPAPPVGEIALATRRVDGQTGTSINDGIVTVQGSLIRKNGWLQPEIRFSRGAVLDAAPQWQQRQARHGKLLATWLTIAAALLVMGLVVLALLRQGYDAPPPESGGDWSSLIPPSSVPPAIAGALVSNGQPQLQHAMGALVALAERGAITVREDAKRFGQRTFVVTRGRRESDLAPHETAVLDAVFRNSERDEISLTKARTNVMGQFKRFRESVTHELQDQGFWHAGRAAHRHRYHLVAIVLLLVAGAALVPCLVMIDRAGPGVLAIPAAIGLVALGSVIFAAAETPLSDEGVRQAQQWRGYQKHLRHPQMIEPRWGGTASAEARILPFALALGVAGAWAKFMKKRGVNTPAWFHANSDVDRGAAFASFIAAGGSGGHGGGAGGASAGGGASGAG